MLPPAPAQSKSLPLSPAVVLLLSQEFISRRYPMEELQLLLEWRRQGSKAHLLPVYYSLTYDDLGTAIEKYGREARESSEAEQLPKTQWVKDLERLQGITGIRMDQVLLGAAVLLPV